MLLINPVQMILRSQFTGRWHPILYNERPLPGAAPAPRRWKSVGHHTDGFHSIELACQYIFDAIERCDTSPLVNLVGSWYHDLEVVLYWDGRGVPASVLFFDLSLLTKHEPDTN